MTAAQSMRLATVSDYFDMYTIWLIRRILFLQSFLENSEIGDEKLTAND